MGSASSAQEGGFSMPVEYAKGLVIFVGHGTMKDNVKHVIKVMLSKESAV